MAGAGILDEDDKDYSENAHPRMEDVLLIIEVADSSVDYDREIKLPLFAGAGISEFWIVNLEERQIEAYSKPLKLGYQTKEVLKAGVSLHFEPLNLTLAVEDIFG